MVKDGIIYRTYNISLSNGIVEGIPSDMFMRYYLCDDAKCFAIIIYFLIYDLSFGKKKNVITFYIKQ